MSRSIFLAFLLFLFSCNTEKQNIENLIYKEDIAFKPDSDKPYTGAVFALKSNGKIDFEGYLTAGKRNGEFTRYGNNENIKKKENYKDGEKYGEFLFYYDNGQLEQKENYKNNKKDGLFESYNESGNKTFEGSYTDGLESGKYKYWFKNGKQIQVELEYSKGTIIIESVKEYYKEGKIKTEFKRLANNQYEMIEYHLNGKIMHDVKFLYTSYEGLINCSYFYMRNVATDGTDGEDKISFDLGNSVNEYFDVEYFKNELGNTTKKTVYFYPNYSSISIKYYNGQTTIYNDVTIYTEFFDEKGILIKKTANSKNGGLGDVPNNSSKLNDMQLLGDSDWSDFLKEFKTAIINDDQKKFLMLSVSKFKDGTTPLNWMKSAKTGTEYSTLQEILRNENLVFNNIDNYTKEIEITQNNCNFIFKNIDEKWALFDIVHYED